MPVEKGQWLKLLKIWEILRQETDEAHPMSSVELLERLEAIDIKCDRRTLYKNPNAILVLDDPITSFDQDRMRLFALLLQELSKNCFVQVILLMHYENFFRVINDFTIENKAILQIKKDKDNHLFVPLSSDDIIFKDNYEALLDKIIRFINADINDISENDVRILFEKYLHMYYACTGSDAGRISLRTELYAAVYP